MPFYKFNCENNHEQDVMLTFPERDSLPKDEKGRQFIPCGVRYGDKEHKECPYNAYQLFSSVNFITRNLKGR